MQLGVYIDAGPVGHAYADARGNPGSTIVDATEVDSGGTWRVLRHGGVPWEDLRAVRGRGVGAVINYVLVALTAVAVSFLLALALWQLGVRYGWHREIRPRDVHQEPTPRLGGIAVYVGMVLATLVASQLPHFEEVFQDPRPIIAVLLAGFHRGGVGSG
jgi:hypothetical protein